MKFLSAIVGAALLSAWAAPAQVTVEIRMEQEQFLPSEKLTAAVRIANSSGQPLHFGADPDWLHFTVESADGLIVMKNGDAPVLGEFDVQSSQVATRRVDLAPYFDLTRSGHYRVTARVHINEWDVDLKSPPKGFDIINGAKIWTQDFGLPLPEGVTNRVPEIRNYSLLQANYLKAQLRLYAQITDQGGSQVYKILPIGPLVSFSQPDAQLDRLSNLHVFWQTGAATFAYVVVSPSGDILKQDVYDYAGSRPRLKVDENGNLAVQGGALRRRPEVPLILSPADVSSLKDTNAVPAPAPVPAPAK